MSRGQKVSEMTSNVVAVVRGDHDTRRHDQLDGDLQPNQTLYTNNYTFLQIKYRPTCYSLDDDLQPALSTDFINYRFIMCFATQHRSIIQLSIRQRAARL